MKKKGRTFVNHLYCYKKNEIEIMNTLTNNKEVLYLYEQLIQRTTIL
jgi:hypothetical protein